VCLDGSLGVAGMSAMETIVDAEVVGEDVSPAPVQEAPSTQLVRRERRSEVIKPLDVGELEESFNAYQALLPRLLAESDYQGAGSERFVKKSGWRKIATAFDLDVQMIRSEVERDESGQPIRAEVWARAVAPSGRSMDGDGYCSIAESRFARAGGRQKLENDLRATATTRAMNRAISGLVGMGAVSAEEVDSANENHGNQARLALGYLLSAPPNGELVDGVLLKIKESAGGYYPYIAIRAVLLTAAAVKEQADAAMPPVERHPAGSVNPPVLSGASMESDLKLLRNAGCTCSDPYEETRSGIDLGCPLRGHGTPADPELTGGE